MESLCLWVVTAPPNYSPLPWVVSLFQQVWNIALEPIIPQFTLGLAWRIVQFLRSAPVQTGKRTQAPVLQCAACVQEADLLGSIPGMFIALRCRQRGRGHSLCCSASIRPLVAHHPAGGQLELLRHCLRNGERFLLLPERWCEQLQCSHSPPSSKKNELQIMSQIHSLDFNPVSNAIGTDICSAVETIDEPISAQGISFLHHLHFLHFLPSSSVLCYFGFSTFWEWSFRLRNRDGDLGSWVEIFTLFINSSHW